VNGVNHTGHSVPLIGGQYVRVWKQLTRNQFAPKEVHHVGFGFRCLFGFFLSLRFRFRRRGCTWRASETHKVGFIFSKWLLDIEDRTSNYRIALRRARVSSVIFFKVNVVTASGGTVVSPRTSHSEGPGSILARGRPPWEGFQWFSYPLQVNTGVVLLHIGHTVYLPPTHPSSSSRYSSITPLFASQSLTTSPFHSDYK